jgi:hypothetical protein
MYELMNYDIMNTGFFQLETQTCSIVRSMQGNTHYTVSFHVIPTKLSFDMNFVARINLFSLYSNIYHIQVQILQLSKWKESKCFVKHYCLHIANIRIFESSFSSFFRATNILLVHILSFFVYFSPLKFGFEVRTLDR